MFQEYSYFYLQIRVIEVITVVNKTRFLFTFASLVVACMLAVPSSAIAETLPDHEVPVHETVVKADVVSEAIPAMAPNAAHGLAQIAHSAAIGISAHSLAEVVAEVSSKVHSHCTCSYPGEQPCCDCGCNDDEQEQELKEA